MRWTSRKEVDSNEKIITNVKRASVFYPNSRRRVRSLLKIKKKKKNKRERGKRKQRKPFALNHRGNKRWREGRIKNDILTLDLIALNREANRERR